MPRGAVGDRNPDAHQVNLYHVDAKYGDVTSAGEVLDHLRASGAARRSEG